MSHWNHRILAVAYNNDIYFQIHEVYYTDDCIPNGYSTNPITIGGEDIKGMIWQINRIKQCMKKPILWAGENFPNEYKTNN